jgi:hypothetical protein
MAVRFQLRRDTAANWTSVNPILALGEPGVETDTLKVKVGDGVTAWNSLAYSITKDFTDLTSKPTTIAGYGITDAVASSSVSVFGASLIDDADATTARTTLGLGTAATTAATAYATAAQGSTADTAVQPGDIGTAAAQSVSYFATAAQGSTADTAVQPGDNIQTSIIDSSDSSAITITPDVVMSAGLTVGNHIVPSSNENVDLGSATNRFRELFLSGNTINLGGALIKRVAGNTVELPIGSNIGGKNIAATDQDLNTTDAVTFANITTSGYLRGPASFVIDPAAFGDDTGTVVIAGNLQVDGTTTTINSTTLTVDDKNIILSSGSPNAAGSDGAGITVDNGSDADATIIYDGINDQWELNKDIHLPDTAKAIFGAGSALQIYHTGSHSWVQDAGTGNLYIAGEQLWLTNSDNTKQFLKGDSTGRVDLYYNTSVKLATTSTGIDVTGEITASGDISTTGGDVDITGAQPRVNLKETDTTDLDVTLRLNAGDFIIETRSDAGTALGDRIRAASNGDISFYEDTGTTAKFFWDASAESLSIGTNGSTGDRRFQVSGSPNDSQTGAQQFGIVANPTYNTNPTSNIFNIYTGPNLTAGTTLTNLYNLYLESNNTAGSTVTNKYGLYQAGTNDKNYFAGNVGVGTSSPVAKLAVVGGTSNASDLATAYSLAAFNITPKSTSGYSLQFGSGPADLPYIQMSAGGAASGNLLIQPYGGNVGIGTTSPNPTALAILTGGGAKGVLLARNASGNPTTGQGFGSFAFKGIMDGTNSIAAAEAAIEAIAVENHSGSSAATALAFYTKASGTGPGSAPAERLRIDSLGNLQLGYGGQSPTAFAAPQGIAISSLDNIDLQYYLRKGNQVEAHIGFGGGTNTNFYVGTGGGPGPGGIGSYGLYQANLSTTWTGTSDERLKTDLEPIENAMDKVRGVRSYTGRFIHDEANGVTRRLPFLIAQDFVTALPEAVDNQDPDKLGLSYSDTVVLLFAAVNELIAENDTLKDRISALEA